MGNNCNCRWPGLLNLFCGCCGNGNGRSGNNGCGCCGNGNGRSGNNGCGCQRNCNGRNGNNGCGCQCNGNSSNFDAYYAAQYGLNNNSCGCNSCNSFDLQSDNNSFGFFTVSASGSCSSCGNSRNSWDY